MTKSKTMHLSEPCLTALRPDDSNSLRVPCDLDDGHSGAHTNDEFGWIWSVDYYEVDGVQKAHLTMLSFPCTDTGHYDHTVGGHYDG